MARRWATGALVVGAAPLLWLVVGVGVAHASPAVLPSAAGQGQGTTTTHTTTAFRNNTVTKGHKGGSLAIVLSFVGVIAVVVLVVALGSISVRRRTGDNPTPGWWRGRGPPDQRSGMFR